MTKSGKLPHSYSALRVGMIFLGLCIVILVILLMTWTGSDTYNSTKRHVRQDVTGLVQVVSTQYDRVIESTNQLLVSLSQIPVIRWQDAEACNTILANIAQQFPQYANLGLVRADGQVVCSTIPAQNNRNLAQLPWFQDAIRAKQFYVSDYQVRRTSGQAVVVLSQPILDDSDRVEALLTAEINLDWLNNLAFDTNLPADSSLTLIDRNSVILTHHPDPAPWVGKNYPNPQIAASVFQQGAGEIEITAPDSVQRLYAFTALNTPNGQQDVFVIVDIPLQPAIEQINLVIIRNLLIFTVLTILIFLIGWLIINNVYLNPLDRVIGTARQLAAGNLSVRTGLKYRLPWEMVLLARTFDDMAVALQEQQFQKEKALRALQSSEERLRRLTENARDIIFRVEYRPGRHFSYVNPACYPMTGYTIEEHYQDSHLVDKLVHPDDYHIYREAIANPDRFQDPVVTRWIRKDGEIIWVEQRIVPFLDENGEIIALEGIVRDITENKKTEEMLRRHLNELEILNSLAMAGAEATSQENLIQRFTDIIGNAIYPKNFGVILVDHDRQTTRLHPSYRMDEDKKIVEFPLKGSIAGRVVSTGQPSLVSDVHTDPDYFLMDTKMQSELCVPIRIQGEIIGVVNAESDQVNYFDETDEKLMEALASELATAMEKVNLYEQTQAANLELSRAYDETIEGWARALDLRDHETEGHSRRVTEITLKLANAFGITGMDLVHVRRGALLHDIGKVGVPDNILLKPGTLTPEEWQVMYRHPEYARQLLHPISFLRPAIDIPYCHHERWDGSGYPRKMQGEDIPLSARLFSIVDVWDALLADRPYRKGWLPADATKYILNHSHTAFDPRVVEAFFDLGLFTAWRH